MPRMRLSDLTPPIVRVQAERALTEAYRRGLEHAALLVRDNPADPERVLLQAIDNLTQGRG